MQPEGDPDRGLLLDRRGGDSYVAKLLMPSHHKQNILPLEQKKPTKSSKMAMNGITMKSVNSALEAFAGALPVVYELSDSEGTPIARPLFRKVSERRPAAVKPKPEFWKQQANAEVVTLSDSDEEVTPAAAIKLSGKVEKLSEPSTLGNSAGRILSVDEGTVDSKLSTVDKLREPVLQGRLLEKAIFLDDESAPGSKFSGKLENVRERISLGPLQKTLSLDHKSKVGSKFARQVVGPRKATRDGGLLKMDISLGATVKVGMKLSEKVDNFCAPVLEGGLQGKAISFDDEDAVGSKLSDEMFKLTETIPDGRENGISLDIEGMVGSIFRTEIPVSEREVVVQTSNLQHGDGAFSRAIPSTTLNYPEYLAPHEIIPAICGSRKRPSFSVEGPNQSDPEHGATRKCFRPAHDRAYEGNKCSSDDAISPITKFQLPRELEMPSDSLGKDPSVGNRGMVASISDAIEVDVALKPAKASVAHLSPRRGDASLKAVPSTKLDPFPGKSNRAKESNVSAYDNYLQISSSSEKLPNNASEGPNLLDLDQEAMSKLSRAAEDYVREENRGNSPVQPALQDLTGDDDGCGSEPERLRRDHEPASPMGRWNSGISVPDNYWDEELSEQCLPNPGGNDAVNDHSGGKKRPLPIPDKNRQLKVSSTGTHRPMMLDPGDGAKRIWSRAAHDSVREEYRSLPIHPALQNLTADDGDCTSDPELLWSHEPGFPRGRRNSGNSAVQDISGHGCHDQFLSTFGRNSELGDHLVGNKKPSLQLPGLDVSPSVEDVESERVFVAQDKTKRKRSRTTRAVAERRSFDDASNLETIVPSSRNVSKARKGAVSAEEVAAGDALKQRERELKNARQEEEKKAREKKREDLKRQKEAAKEAAKQQKEEAGERRKLEKENDKWLKGKFALQNTAVHLSNYVVQMRALGSLLLQQFDSKKYNYKVQPTTIPDTGTIVWKMKRPSADSQTRTEEHGSQADDLISSQRSSSQLALEEVELKYLAIIIQGEDFADLVGKKALHEHISGVREQYPTYSVCYLINGLKRFLHRKEQQEFRKADTSWTRPNVEQALAEFVTHYPGVHPRMCIDESEIVDHLVGLTRSLAECPYKKELTSLSVRANGGHVTKGDPNKDLVKKSTWLKFLVAIPRINGAIAIAIAKKYPTMRGLLNAYLDPLRTVHEKELLLQGLDKEPDRKRIGAHVSKRIYRVLMAKNGNLSTEDAEEGADHFTYDDE